MVGMQKQTYDMEIKEKMKEYKQHTRWIRFRGISSKYIFGQNQKKYRLQKNERIKVVQSALEKSGNR